jgi:hypothetical protein
MFTLTGIVMEPGKKYSTVVENTFHLSMATLDLETVKKGMYKAYNFMVQLNISLFMIPGYNIPCN